MTTSTIVLTALVAAALLSAAWLFRERFRQRAVPAALKPGQALPEIDAVDEQGNAVSSGDLRGAPAVILFVRGNWCPFCTRQVANLAEHYKAIGDLGARLILITPKPLQTTHRVAKFFDVEFDFWLDEDLQIARRLGLLLPAGVPDAHRDDYGRDTVWPTSLVVDADGLIRYTAMSRFIVDRPNAATLVAELRKL